MEDQVKCAREESVIERLSTNLDRISGELNSITDRLDRLSVKAGVRENEPTTNNGEIQKNPENHKEIIGNQVSNMEYLITETHKRISELERFI